MSVGFSETFPIEISIISRALRAYVEEPDKVKSDIASSIGINDRKMNGISGWLRYLNLWEYNKGISDLGQIILLNDKYFQVEETLWLLHYSLVTNEAAEVWYYTFNHFLRPGLQFTRSDIENKLRDASIGITDSGKESKHLTSDVGIMLNSYTEHNDAFRSLQLLTLHNDSYMVLHLKEIPPLIIAYAIYKQRELTNQISTTAISTLLEDEGSPGKAFQLERSKLLFALRKLESEGFLRISQIADLDNVNYTYDGSTKDILERIYSGREK